MKKVLSFLTRNGKYKNAIPVLAIGFMLQAILIAKYLPEFLLYSKGIKNPDQLFSYNSAYLKNLYHTLGEEGRTFYAEMLSIDFLFATISGLGYALLLAALIRKEQWYIVLPLLLAISDISENIAQLLLMHLYPNVNSVGVLIASIFSSVKMVLGLISILLILFFAGRNVLYWFTHKNAA